MTVDQYIEKISARLKSGISREHSYRGDLEILIRELVKGVEITNEPANVTDCGNPDYVITKGKIPVGYIEAKDIGKDLNGKQYKEQFTRYKKALDNLIITDYTWFQFFQNGVLVHEIRIGEIENNTVKPIARNFSEFENLIQNFCTFIGQTIKSSKKLAEMMAAKARLLQDILERAITSDEETQENTSLKGQYDTFKQILIHDLKPKEFADIYAQTLAYGMFAARLHDETLGDFSRQEAAELIPKSNPFLRKLFAYVAGPDIDDRIKRTVDNLADVFRATNVEELLKNFGKSTQANDPIIHFYETFLAEYDPKLRKARGVWYTPEPVVNFIVRAVDDILKTEFGLLQGLADTSKTKIKVSVQGSEKMMEKEVHKVQILDPATGTGTFLAEVVKHIYNKNFKAMQGAWSGYVEEHLLPRLNGFELLMASYSMAHLKLDMLLTATGYKSTKNQRYNIYLTNSLEEDHPDTGTLFSQWLSTEANEANHIKRDTPVMVVMGNPPYSGISINKGKWITDLIEDYKYVDGKHFGERKHWLQDDYVKFLRFGEHFIDKNGEGVLAFINNHSFIDNPTFRGMRWHLLESFDKIYIIDLHGNSKKKEVCPDGSKDENVFDITAGVSINIFIKTGKKKKGELAEVLHYDAWGKRQDKYDYLFNNNIKTVTFNNVDSTKPFYFFIPKDNIALDDYKKAFSVEELFMNNVTGTQTGNDKLLMSNSFIGLQQKLKEQCGIEPKDFVLKRIRYRPFDDGFMYFVKSLSSNYYESIPIPKSYRSRYKVMRNLTFSDNKALIIGRQGQVVGNMPWNLIFISNSIVDLNMFYRGGGMTFPLYLYTESETDGVLAEQDRVPNLNQEIVNQISEKLNLTFTNEKEETENSFAPIDILDYIYAVLHSPNYREKYKEFLKIDFPRVPYPKDKETFWQLVKLGGEIRQIHLLESPKVEEYITSYPQDGDNRITRKLNKNDWEITSEQGKQTPCGRIWINDKQYFENIPLLAWEFYIGGYQPAQKWLKDRKGRQLSFEDILHYQKIIVALAETDRIMKVIDKIEIE